MGLIYMADASLTAQIYMNAICYSLNVGLDMDCGLECQIYLQLEDS